jgi:hypothetical protein
MQSKNSFIFLPFFVMGKLTGFNKDQLRIFMELTWFFTFFPFFLHKSYLRIYKYWHVMITIFFKYFEIKYFFSVRKNTKTEKNNPIKLSRRRKIKHKCMFTTMALYFPMIGTEKKEYRKNENIPIFRWGCPRQKKLPDLLKPL